MHADWGPAPGLGQSIILHSPLSLLPSPFSLLPSPFSVRYPPAFAPTGRGNVRRRVGGEGEQSGRGRGRGPGP
jgi:hypothetical protein